MAKAILTINEPICKGCLLCADACPKKVLEVDLTKVNVKGYNPIAGARIEDCTACGICARICPDSVIKVERSEVA